MRKQSATGRPARTPRMITSIAPGKSSTNLLTRRLRRKASTQSGKPKTPTIAPPSDTSGSPFTTSSATARKPPSPPERMKKTLRSNVRPACAMRCSIVSLFLLFPFRIPSGFQRSPCDAWPDRRCGRRWASVPFAVQRPPSAAAPWRCATSGKNSDQQNRDARRAGESKDRQIVFHLSALYKSQRFKHAAPSRCAQNDALSLTAEFRETEACLARGATVNLGRRVSAASSAAASRSSSP